ncbi:shikimate dehydrogenase [Arthrobacter sp. NicSoilB8]|uniref:shikimate dehydrogenase n=1 Tax=Arthrobacter sp. NicSoilB8 TaxID=2830998 RepID=UPI001CC4F392|nr:shikimate dehydrogenase [Arthrobacter sp. NicSoilB8]BCW71602.1 shikimate dehydrogenase (NADP(+)) [Arthrobacter sp. NicSoilB8]
MSVQTLESTWAFPGRVPDRTHRHLVGLLGAGIAGSLTPGLHESEADRLGLSYTYRVIDLDAIGQTAERSAALVRSAADLGYDGLNVTHPSKQLVQAGLDDLSPDARILGAVNTITFHDGKAVGHNTDHLGFLGGFRAGLPSAATNLVVQVGAGGAGAAVAFGLLRAGAKQLVIADIDPAKAESLAARLAPHFPDSEVSVTRTDAVAPSLLEADGLVNTTPIGMSGHPGLPLDPRLIHSRLWVADVIYRPLETQLIKAARARGCEVLDGGRMVVGQAVAAFELFTGIRPDADSMLASFQDAVRS